MRDPTASWYMIEEAGPDGSADPTRAATDRGRDPGPGGRSGAPDGPGDPGALGSLGVLGGGPAVARLALAAAAGAVVAAALVLAVGGAGAPAVAVDAVGADKSPPAAKDSSASPGSAAPAGGGPSDAGGGADGGVGSAPDLVVDVEGAVLHPGIVRLPGGARVGEAIAAAGGYAPSVDVDRAPLVINLAAPVADGDRIRVPAIGDAEEAATTPAATTPGAAAPGDGSAAPGSAAATPLDLNRATQAELEALPGIGPVTAGKIIDARASARFASVQDLRDRKLVGAATFAKIAPLVTAGP
jgi:competence protein ComEA